MSMSGALAARLVKNVPLRLWTSIGEFGASAGCGSGVLRLRRVLAPFLATSLCRC